MSDLVEFLLARIAEDEAIARAATDGPWIPAIWDLMIPEARAGHTIRSGAGQWVAAQGHDDGGVIGVANAAHIARHDPTRVLADCAAKRRIVELHEPPCDECLSGEYVTIDQVDVPRQHGMDPCQTLRLLVQPYADHPYFNPAWTPRA